MGRAYSLGSRDYESNENVKTEINELNKDVTQEKTSIESKREIEPIVLSGIGKEATELFSIEGGLTKFTLTNKGSSNFIVWLLDSSGNRIDLIVNEIGNFEGTKSFGLKQGNYLLDISSEGVWDIKIEQSRDINSKKLPLIFSDIGKKSTDIFHHKGGLIRFKMIHIGSSNFIVWLLDENGNRIDLLANEIGSFEGSKAIGLKQGNYLFDVSADGSWEISAE